MTCIMHFGKSRFCAVWKFDLTTNLLKNILFLIYAYFNFVSDKVEMGLLGAVECVHFGGPSTAHVLEGEPSIINIISEMIKLRGKLHVIFSISILFTANVGEI